ncbi:tigger transposable element-derived protein 1-like [Octopus bimaculoides]|uniref:tigger transposable element-derived protein 1-like n=1 Tax=Octopus bimaculoides TaxID=37653 RepID=UPI00071CA318|nr:tigger transposable element-derived protein 1-like [Octopus bimaculoides]|eukprot:XP_014788567.1 PREDICTED: tigger transposable element-derived protein 1-like [Octopus bimaculoides]
MTGKRPSNGSQSSSVKRSRKGITLDVKLDILRRFDAGEKLSHIAKSLKLAASTVGTIRDNKDKIRKIAQETTPLTARTLFFHRSDVMLKMERLLSVWINEQTRHNVPISAVVIQAKAKTLYEHLQEKEGATSVVKPFLASKGWFERFKKRFKLHKIKMNNGADSIGTNIDICTNTEDTMANTEDDIYDNIEADTEVNIDDSTETNIKIHIEDSTEDTKVHIEANAEADMVANTSYVEKLKKMIVEGGYTPEQVYNVDETGLFWKRMPAGTFISNEEKSAPGFKVSKDRLTLLVGGNAAGNMKLKPLLVYHSENPKAFKGYAKSNLPVIWRSNKKAWMTTSLFQDWFTNFFCPAIEIYSAKRNISNKALLLLDNAPSHPVNLNDLSDNVRVEFIPKNTASLLQPMDQGVVALFKAYYHRRIFKQLIKAIDGEDKTTVRDYWTKFNIMNAVDNIADSWNEVKLSTMNSVWKNIWPDCVRDFTDFPPVESLYQVQQDIVTLTNSAGFEEVKENDVIELLVSHRESLSNEELLLLEQDRAAEEEEEDIEAASTQLQLNVDHLATGLALIQEGLQIFADNDPNRERNIKVIRGVHNELRSYIELYKEKLRHYSQ